MIESFKGRATEDLFNGVTSKAARNLCPQSLWTVARRKLDQLDSVTALHDLKIPPGNRLETLSGNKRGQNSIRINKQFRICFIWGDSGPINVHLTDYH